MVSAEAWRPRRPPRSEGSNARRPHATRSFSAREGGRASGGWRREIEEGVSGGRRVCRAGGGAHLIELRPPGQVKRVPLAVGPRPTRNRGAQDSGDEPKGHAHAYTSAHRDCCGSRKSAGICHPEPAEPGQKPKDWKRKVVVGARVEERMRKEKILRLAKGFRGRAKNCFRVSLAAHPATLPRCRPAEGRDESLQPNPRGGRADLSSRVVPAAVFSAPCVVRPRSFAWAAH